jgi:hypothetical protein
MRSKIERGYAIDVFAEFERRVEIAIDAMDEYTMYLRQNGTPHTRATVIQADALQLPTQMEKHGFTPDLIFFSPPYCNAIEYWRRHRLEYFLGRFLDEAGVAELHHRSVGRTTIGRNDTYLDGSGFEPVDRVLQQLLEHHRPHKACVLAQYFCDMKACLKVFVRALPSRGWCVIVVGDSTTGGRRIPTARAIRWLAEQVGFDHVQTHRYQIKNRVMQFPLKSNQRIEHESVIVLRKPKRVDHRSP